MTFLDRKIAWCSLICKKGESTFLGGQSLKDRKVVKGLFALGVKRVTSVMRQRLCFFCGFERKYSCMHSKCPLPLSPPLFPRCYEQAVHGDTAAPYEWPSSSSSSSSSSCMCQMVLSFLPSFLSCCLFYFYYSILFDCFFFFCSPPFPHSGGGGGQFVTR